ncbi:hypothetical protein ACC771_24440, partial [Rhizobium ruizarguesonis]
AIAEKGSVFDMAGTLRQTGRASKEIVHCSVRWFVKRVAILQIRWSRFRSLFLRMSLAQSR